MSLRRILGFALSIGIAVNAQQINIRGKVSDAKGKAVANAVVEISRLKKKDTTGVDGSFAIEMAANALQRHLDAPAGEMVLRNGVLKIVMAFSAPVQIEIFDMRGNSVKRDVWGQASAGEYQIDLAGMFPAEKLLMIKASIGRDVRLFRYFSGFKAEGMLSASQAKIIPTTTSLAKFAAAVDTLLVSAVGFTSKSLPLSSYDTTVNVTLDSSGGGLKNPAAKSSGCGKATTLTNGKKTITSTNQQRTYIIDLPANYDMNKPYRLFYCSHWIGSTSEAVQEQNFYFLKPLATAANEPAIFIAPQSDGSTWQQKDHALFEDILAYAKENLCFDTTRVFATGFSFGGMITYSLSTNHQSQIRAGSGIAPANFNIWLPNPKLKEPIAWMQTTGMGDDRCPWINGGSTTQGAKFMAMEKATDNGCTVPANIPTWQSGNHICYDFQGCKAGYPTKACTFNGGHTNIANDAGSSANWIATESWKFFTQF